MARGCPRRRWVRRPFHRKAGERNMVAYKTLDQLDVAGKRVLVRVDLNVPMQDGKVSDATRIERLVPTIEALSRAGAKVILLSHFGRPKGKKVPDQSLAPLVAPLSAALGGKKVAFADDH